VVGGSSGGGGAGGETRAVSELSRSGRAVPGRPASVARALALGLAVLLVMTLGASLVLRVHASTRLSRARATFEREVGSLDVARHAPEPVAREQSAGQWLLEGANALTLDDEQVARLARRISADGWTPEDEAWLVALLAEQEPALATMRRAGSLERSNLGVDYARFPRVMPDLMPLMRASRLLVVECGFRLHRGELEESMATLRLLERMAASLRHEPTLITQLVGGAIEGMYLERLEAVLAQADDAVLVGRLAEDLDHLERLARPLRDGVLLESIVAHHWLATLEETSAERDLPVLLRWWTALPRAIYSGAGLGLLLAAVQLESTARVVARLEQPMEGLDRTAFERDVLRVPRWLPTGWLVRSMATNHLSAIHRDQATLSARRLARVVLGQRQARLAGAPYPASLQQLPASLYTGETATWRLLPDGSAELAFPETERAWESIFERTAPRTQGESDARRERSSRAPNLVWRLAA
jgi:hypothetical protein